MRRRRWRCESSWSAKPSFSIAAAESPPPIMETAPLLATAVATATVPFAKFSHSETPIGPFQTTVPGAFDCLSEELLCCLADVKSHPAVGNSVGVDSHEGCVLVILTSDNVVNGDNECNALRSCLCHKVSCKVKLVVFADRGTVELPHGLHEGVCHTAGR